MFSKSKSIMAIAAAAVFSAGLGLSQILPSAEAQSSAQAPVILTVDMARLLGMSIAGKDIVAQMRTLETEAEGDLTTFVEELKADAAELDNKKETMAEDELNQAAQGLMQRRNSIPYLKEIKTRELDTAEQKAFSEVSQAAVPILDEIVKSRGATVLIERSNLLYAAQATDITQEALTKLDGKLKNVKVEKIDLIEEAKKAQAAQAQQQQ